MSLTPAVVVIDGIATVQDLTLPRLQDDSILVRVKAIALNPADWKHIDYGTVDNGCRVGCDFSGVVEDTGCAVQRFRKGSRIAGFVRGCDRAHPANGAFAHHIVVKEGLQLLVPGNTTDEEAATLGVAITTIGQSLYRSLHLPMPTTPAPEASSLLIHAASTATGLLGVQYAKASGLKVIATCSPHNFDEVRSMGADVVVDYRSPQCAADIKRITDNRLRYAWDCIGTGVDVCIAALSDSEPVFYTTINPMDKKQVRKSHPNVQIHITMAYDAFGEEYLWEGEVVPPKPDELEFAISFFQLSQRLLAAGSIKPITPTVNYTGSDLGGAVAGLDELRSGSVSGTKLVYTI
ncbi:GroES-like protein [Apiospora marii]|uniref:GroES-like protein n=1 Tax=Apiospora marii TaxID=335849 RepID=A0ABR1S9M8_9PEZI